MLFLLSILRGPYSAGSHGCKSSQHSWLVETITTLLVPTGICLFLVSVGQLKLFLVSVGQLKVKTISSICWPVETISSICWAFETIYIICWLAETIF